VKQFLFYGIQITFLFLILGTSQASDRGVIDELKSLPEDKIDVGRAALLLASEVYPGLDVDAYSEKIDTLVNNIRILTRGRTDPDWRVRAMNTYLYQHEKFQYDLTDPRATKPENRYLNGILDSKKGSCVTLPLLYLAVAQRLGYPVYAVVTPEHMFLRYVAPGFKMNNIEATGDGGYSSDEQYKVDFQISDEAVANGVYLRTMTYRELLGDLIAQNGIHWGQSGDIARATEYLEVAAKLFPKGVEIHDNLARVYLYLSRKSSGKLSESYKVKAEAALRKAKELGITRLSADNQAQYVKRVKQEYQKTMGAKK
jgi:regulator of sirC expression with transglutaminase-like and TPR domain